MLVVPAPEGVHEDEFQQCADRRVRTRTPGFEFGGEQADGVAQLVVPTETGRQVEDIGQLTDQRMRSAAVELIDAAQANRALSGRRATIWSDGHVGSMVSSS